MKKQFIRFRKRYILPYLWYLLRRKEIISSKTRDIEELLNKRDSIKERLTVLIREDALFLIKAEEAKLELINWVIQKYDNTKTE